MPLITDPDDLTQGTEVIYDTVNKTIELVIAGNLSTDGATEKAIYSFTKEEWKNDANLIRHDFPFQPITDTSFELKDGWNWKDDPTRYLVRTGGWSVVNSTGAVTEIWANIRGLGAIGGDDQLYFDLGAGAVDFELTGQVNQAIPVYSDPNGDGSLTGGFDRRSQFTMYVREQGQEFGQASLSDIGVSQMSNESYSLPISTKADVKIAASDNDIETLAPYTGMSITYRETASSETIGGTGYDFGIVIDGNNGTAEQIYEFVQYQLRQPADADADADAPVQVGSLQDELLVFVGENLSTLSANNADGGGSGVYIDNFNAADTNRLAFTDNLGVVQSFPFVAGLELNFNSNLQNSSDAVYRVFFTDIAGANFDDSDAILVEDESGTPISGVVGGQASLSFTFDYDGNVQGGRTAGTDADITVVAIGTDNAQHVLQTGTITRSNSNVVTLVSPLERNYENV